MLLGDIAEVYFLTGEYDKALSCEVRCLALTRVPTPLNEANTLLTFGDIHAALGHVGEAHTAWSESATVYERLGAPRAAEARRRLGK